MDARKLICPICERAGLAPSPSGKRIRPDVVICSNEFVTHFLIGDYHFLAKTERNVLEELNLEQESVVLN